MSEPPFDPNVPLPFDGDAYADTPQKDGPTPYGAFAYIGQAHTIQSFAAYVQTYNFGTVPPDYVVLHHTAVPSTLYARYPSGAVWDANESGLTEAQIQAKRKQQLDAIMVYYRDTKGWTAGPHLFCDERWIWLFTPMYDVGIHAAEGNSYRDDSGALHYSIGIEVIGYYEHVTWPSAVAQNVAGAVDALCQRLKTFGYIDKPWAGGISAHRHYNKPACPGAAIQPAYYMPVLKSGGALPPKNYRVLGIPVYQESDRNGPLWGHLVPGESIAVDDPNNGHLADHRGFIRLDPDTLEPL